MEKVVLQVHFCGCEESLNDFLQTLSLEGENYPKLQSITYIPKSDGIGNNENIQVNGSVIAAVQFFVKIKNDRGE